MAAVAVTLKGTLYNTMTPGDGDQGQPVTLVALGYYTDLVVGGGPILPPPTPPGFPAFPIVLPPDAFPPGQGPSAPGGYPDYIWGAPIVPVTPDSPPIGMTPPGEKPPPPGGGWGFWPGYGWGYFPGQGQPGPKGKR